MPQILEDRKYADLTGGRTAYLDSGTGRPLILVHGVGLNASVWRPQIERFSGHHRVVAYDTLGHGGSDYPAADASLSDYAAQLGALMDELDLEHAALLGHSMGALIVTLFALDRPDRADCVIAANPVYRRPVSQIEASRDRIQRIESEGPAAGLDENLARWFGDPASTEASSIEQVKRWVGHASPEGYAVAYRVFSEADPWLAGRLGDLTTPALFVTGALDPNSTPSMARTMAAEAPRGEFSILNGERHMMAYVSPRRFNTVAGEFLDRSMARRETPLATANK